MKNKINQEERAYKAWNILTQYAKDKQYITYKELGDKIGIHHRAIRYVLGLIQDYCIDNEYPPLTILVVNKDSGKPGEGFIAWDIESSEDGVKKVQEKDWLSLNNPFGFAETGFSSDKIIQELINNPDSSADIYSKVKVRGVAQRLFRRTLLKVYDYSCCMCGLSFENVLEACHIIPYSRASNKQRLEIGNGLLLCSNHHKMFDAGQIIINQDYIINFFDMEESEGGYSEYDRLLTTKLHGAKIKLPKNDKHKPDLSYLAEHKKSFEE